jgi:pimeloyl-ACP methyl ester carboxylesterase
MRIVISLLMLSTLLTAATAHAEPPPKPETIDIDGHTGMLYAAPAPAPGKPWVLYAPTFAGLSLTQRKAYFDGFRQAGIAIAGLDLGEVRGAPSSTAEFGKFYDELVDRGYSPKPILIGQSRGGLMMLGWAMRHPDKTGAFVGIYPCCNLETWGMKNLKATLPDYQLTEDELRKRMKEFNPVDNLDAMIKAKLPIFIVHGDIDKAVPIKENTLLLKERYEAGGGPITVKIIPGEGHEPTSSFFECPELYDFVVKQAGGRPTPMPTTRALATPAPNP